MILEGIMTTVSAGGEVNISPMGPLVDREMNHLTFRPFQTSMTYQNLKRTGQGVFHVIDDVELLARAAIGALDTQPPLRRAEAVDGYILADACRWYAVKTRSIDDSDPRAEIAADVIDRGFAREFFGFNRAKHAVVEAAILATRIGILPTHEIGAEFERLRIPVEKTGGSQERAAFDLLANYVQRSQPSEIG